jgi:predicted nuclease of predicted toxin-antitoxin system
MEVLLDNQLNGMDRFLRIQGYNVTTAFEVGYTKKTDEEVIKYAKKHNMVLITEDNKAAKLAELLHDDIIHLDMKMKSIIVVDELRKKVAYVQSQ